MLFEIFRAQTSIFRVRCPPNSMDPRLTKFFIFWERMESHFGIVLFPLELDVALKSDTVRHFCSFTDTRGVEQPSYVRSPDCSLRLVKMADSGRFEFTTKAYFGPSEKNYFGVYFFKLNTSFLAYFEYFKQYLS